MSFASRLESFTQGTNLPIKREGNDIVVSVTHGQLLRGLAAVLAAVSIVLMILSLTHELNLSAGWQAGCDAMLSTALYVMLHHKKYVK